MFYMVEVESPYLSVRMFVRLCRVSVEGVSFVRIEEAQSRDIGTDCKAVIDS
jgi:hypothetical protein